MPAKSAVLDADVALLFVPGDRPERFAKAAAACNLVILDLEDGVGPDAKSAAREHVLAAAGQDPDTYIVRVNPVGSPWFADDIAAAREAGVSTIMLPKAESRAQLDEVADFKVIALCETASGVVHATDVAAAECCVALFWGSEDLVASCGGWSSKDAQGRFRGLASYARAHVLLAAASAGLPAIDSVYLDTNDDAGLHSEALDGAESGFAAKACIHPRQVATVRRAYAPSDERLAWARGVLQHAGAGQAVFLYDGQMIDEPLLRQARRVIAAVENT